MFSNLKSHLKRGLQESYKQYAQNNLDFNNQVLTLSSDSTENSYLLQIQQEGLFEEKNMGKSFGLVALGFLKSNLI